MATHPTDPVGNPDQEQPAAAQQPVPGRKVTGLRVLTAADGNPRGQVAAIGARTSYWPGSQAACERRRHAAPNVNCRCGYNAYRPDTTEAAQLQPRDSHHIVADVEGTGVVINYELGWRAEHQTIINLHVSDKCLHCQTAINAVSVHPSGNVHQLCSECSPDDATRLPHADLRGLYNTTVTPTPWPEATPTQPQHDPTFAFGITTTISLSALIFSTFLVFLPGTLRYQAIYLLPAFLLLTVTAQYILSRAWPTTAAVAVTAATGAVITGLAAFTYTGDQADITRLEDTLDTAAATITSPDIPTHRASTIDAYNQITEHFDRNHNGLGYRPRIVEIDSDNTVQIMYELGWNGACTTIDETGRRDDPDERSCDTILSAADHYTIWNTPNP